MQRMQRVSPQITLREVTALAALAQALVAWADDLLDRGELPAPPREWTVRENRWLAARYGIDARLIVETADGPLRRPIRELVPELIEQLTPTATRLGIASELNDLLGILEHGSGSIRQRRLVERGASLLDVVHHLADELSNDSVTGA